MGLRTGKIKFSVRDRGRTFRGQGRNFDTGALATLLNGPAVQEQVRLGDCLGYYGHWPRVKFGLRVPEGALVNGKVVNLEPAVRCISLRADPDGTIEHEHEFLDTAAGRIAERMHKAKAGGFSSAIEAPRRGSQQVPTGFFGFDFVHEPNFTKNRGYTLDGVELDEDLLEALSDDEMDVLDDIAQYNELLDSTNAVLDRFQLDYDALAAENARMAAMINLMSEENSDLIGALAKVGKNNVLDSVGHKAVVIHATESRFDNANEFHDADLPAFVDPDAPKPNETVIRSPSRAILDSVLGPLLRRYGVDL